MRHVIFGTAGHVDHGKTSLVRALTGFDCDTHPEEKRRGITMNLGFTHCNLPAGRISFIDVPGHKDFIATMVAGSGGIDHALLVIAADEGVMPQTREHICILTLLGINGGIVALSRIDLIDDEVREAAERETREAIKGSVLESCPILAVSATDGTGLSALRNALDTILMRASVRQGGPVFRMFIDRSFIKSGHGAIVAGTVLGGSIETGQSLYLAPGNKEYRIRSMERHGEAVDVVGTGDRVSLNLVGLHQQDVRQGMVLTDQMPQPCTLLDVRIEYTAEFGNLGVRSQAIILLGTQRCGVAVHLLDVDQLSTGGRALAQLHVDRSCIAFRGDRFILRNTSGDATLGGGEVIDAHPLHHRRRRASMVEELHRIAKGSMPELIAHEARKSIAPVAARGIALTLGMHVPDVLSFVSRELPSDVVSVRTSDDVYLLRKAEHDRIGVAVHQQLALSHKRNPLEDGGRSIEELMSLFGAERASTHEPVLRAMLVECEHAGTLKRVRETWALPGHSVNLTALDHAHLAFVERFHQRDDMSTPLMSTLRTLAHHEGISERRLHHLLYYLTRRGTLTRIGEEYLHTSTIDACRYHLLSFLEQHLDGATVACFRDLVRGNRRICLLLLSHFDGEGIIERQGDYRYITEAGRRVLAQMRTQHHPTAPNIALGIRRSIGGPQKTATAR